MKLTSKVAAIALIGSGMFVLGGSVALGEIGPSGAFGSTNIVAPTKITYATKLVAQYPDGETIEIPLKAGQDPKTVKIPPKKMKKTALKNSGNRAKKVAIGAIILVLVGTILLILGKNGERKYRLSQLEEHSLQSENEMAQLKTNLEKQAEAEKELLDSVEGELSTMVAPVQPSDYLSKKESEADSMKESATEEETAAAAASKTAGDVNVETTRVDNTESDKTRVVNTDATAVNTSTGNTEKTAVNNNTAASDRK